MTDLIVAARPISEPPVEVVIVRLQWGTVTIEHVSHNGRNDKISRPASEAVRLFWRFMIEKFGVHPTPSGAPSNDDSTDWPTDKLNALRLGQRLVAEVPASAPGRRAFIEVRPQSKPEDLDASREGWRRPDSSRSFVIEQWEYAEEHLDCFDYDLGATRLLRQEASDEAALQDAVTNLGLTAASFDYPWNTADPR
jgi:hypothetical protein